MPRARRDGQITWLLDQLRIARVSIGVVARAARVPRDTAADYFHGRLKRPKADTQRRLVTSARAAGVRVGADPWRLVTPTKGTDPPKHGRRTKSKTATTATPTSTTPKASRVAEPLLQEDEEVIPTRTVLEFHELQHFGLEADPFADTREFWVSPNIEYLRRTLVTAIVARQIVAMCGEVGSGKSTLLRALHAKVHERNAPVVWMTPGNLDRGAITVSALAGAMLRDLQVEGRGSLTSAEQRGEALRQELERRVLEGEHPVLVIDEAHEMSVDGLIAVKRVWDSFTFNKALAVLLVGQLPLKTMLERNPNVREVSGRTTVRTIAPLRTEEIAEYLTWRFEKLAKTDIKKVFAPDTFQALERRGAGGMGGPLWVDARAGAAMRLAKHLGERRVTAEIVSRA